MAKQIVIDQDDLEVIDTALEYLNNGTPVSQGSHIHEDLKMLRQKIDSAPEESRLRRSVAINEARLLVQKVFLRWKLPAANGDAEQDLIDALHKYLSDSEHEHA